MLLNEQADHAVAPKLESALTILVLCTGNSARSIMAEALHVHSDFSDPAAAQGSPDEIRATFSATFLELKMYIVSLMKLPLERFSKHQVANALIGEA